MGQVTSAAFVIPGTGITAAFSAGNYSTDNLYRAATPIPETFLEWIVAGVSVDVLRKRGVNAQDPQIEQVYERYKEVWGETGEIAQAANSKDGLFDLPDNDADNATNISSAGPISYSETSPYVGADYQEQVGRCEDARVYQGPPGPYGTFNGA
jgi:hypothetical protein